MSEQHGIERTKARARRSERLLPGRPAATDESAGPVPDRNDPRRARRAVRAICCSGGGIRAAAFALGGLQTLNATTDGQEPTETFYGRADLVCAVSGGSYIASSYALIEQGRTPDAQPLTYAPGSPEDARLRAHTRYLVDSKTQLSISMLGVVYGLVMNLLPFLAAAYVLSELLGLALGRHALDLLRVTPNGRNWSMAYPPQLYWTIIGVACAGALIYVVFRIVDTYRSVGQLAATRCGVLSLSVLAAAAVGAVLFLAVPAALQLLGQAPGRISRLSWSGLTATIGGLVTALLPVVQLVVRGSGSASAKGAPGLGHRILDRLLPWVGTVLITLLFVLAVLAWTWNSALDHDGAVRWIGVGGAAVGLLLWQALTDVNRTSLHRFYAQRLASAFGVRRDGFEPTQDESSLSTFTRGPQLVICATANTDQPGVVPTGRGCAPFTFSPGYAGISSGAMFRAGRPALHDTDWLSEREFGDPVRTAWSADLRADCDAALPALGMTTADIETRTNGMTLMDMVAVSGAAVSPAMGRMSRPSLRLVLGVANVRLGMWVPNPMHPRWAAPAAACTGWVQRLRRQLRQPGLLALWREIIGGITLNGAWLYVTDGGHYENLGLVEALRRGATEIVAFDASGDRPFTLSTFGEAVETARADLGIEIELDGPDVLAQAGQTGRAGALAAHATATYANGVRADIYLCKAAMIDGLPLDVEAWHGGHPSFPNDSTGNQLYGDREFEAYRRLGQAAAEQALALMPSRTVAPCCCGRPTTACLTQHAASL